MKAGADDPEIYRSVEKEYRKEITITPSSHPYLRLAATLAIFLSFVAFAVLLVVAAAKVTYDLALWVWGVM